jgi:leucyl-tRNA synthetase
MRRTSHGMILGEDGQKMSKSRGNVINPDDVIRQYGADTLRMYEMFVGDFEKTAPWSTNSIRGCKRFLDRVWALQDMLTDGDAYRPELVSGFHKAIKKVSEDIESLKFNTAIATLMALVNDIYATGSINRAEMRTFLLLLNPFAPHLTEEIYETHGFGGVLNEQRWPEYDEALCQDETVEIVVQICGKVKTKLQIQAGADQETVLAQAAADPKIASLIEGKQIIKQIYVQNKLVNFVVK